MINECSNSWLEMVPTIEGGFPLAQGLAALGQEPRSAEGATRPLVMDELNSHLHIVVQ